MGDTTSASGRKPKPLPPFLRGYLRVVDYVSHDLLGGPKVMKMCVPINFQKGATLFFSLACMAYYDRWDSPTAWMYTALHGSYGLCWLLKEMVFPDPKWQDYITLGGAAGCIVSVLAPYWLAPWLLMRSNYEASPIVLGIATIMYALGLVTMIGSDAQKYFTLQHKKGLITTGFFCASASPQLLRRDDGVRIFRAVERALRSVVRLGVRVDRSLPPVHPPQGSQHESPPRVERLQTANRLRAPKTMVGLVVVGRRKSRTFWRVLCQNCT